ncbi:hypothetical protein ACVWYO_003503 [Sphingomonas sp. UYP23]
MSTSRRPGEGRGRCAMTRIVRLANTQPAPASAGATLVVGATA